jgi:hypothetical protein
MIDHIVDSFDNREVNRRFDRLDGCHSRLVMSRLTNGLVDRLNPDQVSDLVKHAAHRRVVGENDRLVHAT